MIDVFVHYLQLLAHFVLQGKCARQPQRKVAMNYSDAPAVQACLSLSVRDLPGIIPMGYEIFAIGDVHGQATLLSGVLDEIHQLPRTSGIKRKIVFLGDLIDRGPDSAGAVALAMDAVRLGGVDEVVLLPGNHELALFGALEPDADPTQWLQNGGNEVLNMIKLGWQGEPWASCQELLRRIFPASWLSAVRDAPSHLMLGDLLFVHAGINPHENRADALRRDRVLDDEHWATIRYPFLNWQGGWDIDPSSTFLTIGPTVVVHGHTPALRGEVRDTADLEQMDGIADFRCICVDAGAAYRPQLGWAHFWNHAGRGQVRLSVSFTPAVR